MVERCRQPGLSFSGKRVTVMGLGRFGGGVGVARWLARQGADVLMTDVQPAEKLGQTRELEALKSCGSVEFRLGEHREADFTQCDVVIANPAIPQPWQNPFLNAARSAGIPITTEIRLVAERLNRNRVIGVTGSAGKSTTAAMIHHIANRQSICSHFGGNIGGSLLDTIDDIRPDDWIVLELSSAMLHWLGHGMGYEGAEGWSPHLAVLTNIVPNHIDWHGSFEHYRQSKLNIFRWQNSSGVRATGDDVADCSEPLHLKIPGSHNQVNARLAIAAVGKAFGTSRQDAADALADFTGLPHRLQLVAERDGLRFYNDSKSTTPQATVLAVEAFDNATKVHLIAGGYDKGVDLASISQLAERMGGLYTIGATGRSLAIRAACGFAHCCETLDVAIATALNRMESGDILLLSPGCASWDQYINYEQRGAEFVRLIHAHIRPPPRP